MGGLTAVSGKSVAETSDSAFLPFIAKDVTTENSAERTFFSGTDRCKAPSYPFPEILLGW